MRNKTSLLVLFAFSLNYLSAQSTLQPSADSVHMKFFVSDWDDVPESEAEVTLKNNATAEVYKFVSDIDGRYEMLLPKNSKFDVTVYRFDTSFVFSEASSDPLIIPDMAYLSYSHQFKIKIMQEFISDNSSVIGDGAKSYKRIFNLDVLFPTAKWDLDNNDKKELDKLVDQLKQNSKMKIELAAHTDNVGDDESNMRLSQQRANSVRDYLASKGIESSRMMSKGYGEKKPVASNDTSEGRQLNRRTECRVIYE